MVSRTVVTGIGRISGKQGNRTVVSRTAVSGAVVSSRDRMKKW